jgi:nucleoside 2-deoxyribosyltransferase
MTRVYVIGSLENPDVPGAAEVLRREGAEVADSWHAAGPRADREWERYERARGRTMDQALRGLACRNVVAFDKRYIDMADIAVLVMPCGRSGHLELGYAIGSGKQGIVYLPQEPERWDAMYGLAHEVVVGVEELAAAYRRCTRRVPAW